MIEENINGSTGVSLFAVFDGHVGDFVADYAIGVLTQSLMKKISESNRVLKQMETSEAFDMSSLNCGDGKKSEAPKTFNAACYVREGANINYARLITDEILAADHHIVQIAKKSHIRAGSTAHIALLDGNKLTVANVGDSRGVMCDFAGNAIPLSFDHKPENEEEKKRIGSINGGYVAHHGVWRVVGRLAMSRALGDYEFKNGMVIADPDIRTFDLAEHK